MHKVSVLMQPTPRTPLQPPRYLTEEIAGIGGALKRRPEDFLVQETPLYDPAGEGEHLYLMVEKRSLSTFDAIGVLARHFGVRHEAIGYAGLKDKHAITRQVFSVHCPGKKPEDFPMLQHELMAVLWADMHTNKLRQGHLKGNRFSIKVREVEMTRALPAKRVLDRLTRSGVPNYFGEQRFGHMLNNHLVGEALIKGAYDRVLEILLGPDPAYPESQPSMRAAFLEGDYERAFHSCSRALHTERTILRMLVKGVEPKHAVRATGPRALGFFISSWQSAIFNRVLAERVASGTFDRLLEGDLAFHHQSRNTFEVTPEVLALEETRPRLASFEISPSGPMWGTRMRRASGAIDADEVRALEASGVTLEDLATFDAQAPHLIEGARRPLRVPITDTDVEGGTDEHGPYVRCMFDLPRGSFATTVMREVMKPVEPGAVADEEA